MSLFSARHYVWFTHFSRQALRDAYREEYSRGPNEDVVENTKTIIERLADALTLESEGFDRKRFLHDVFSETEPETD